MSSETDPRELMRRHEERLRARLGRTGRELTREPRKHADGAIDWVRAHPHVSLGIAAGSGFLLAATSRRTDSVKQSAAKVASAGKLMLVARLASSVTSLLKLSSPGSGPAPGVGE